MKQFSLFPDQYQLFHGGELAKGKRKSARPLAKRRPIHLVLKAKINFYREREWIEAEARRFAERFGLKIFSLAVNHDHAHFVFVIPGRREYSAFMRSFTARIAKKLGTGLWSLAPFTRVANWGRDFQNLLGYLRKNPEEASGARAYQPRKDSYKRLRPKP